ncbi:MAG: protein kinase [Gammaproteobacteria bacterium]
MDVSVNKQLFVLVEQALTQEPADRAGWLRENCSAELYGKAASLLKATEGATVNSNDLDVAFDFGSHKDYLGQQVGPYRIKELIGEGGMGYVFSARRDDGAYEQTVAIKLIRVSVTDATLVERFERERQILSDLNHPNIAALYDGGATEKGVPYLVMEFVDGLPIDRYIETYKLDVDAVLDLFVKIASAVRAAHRALVIHRDIKPANIIVGRDGEPKLLDFGIARSLDPATEGAEKTKLVRLTPSYASPEQIRDEPLTTATDVYSLGVVLFEALTGELPFDVGGLSAFEAEQLMTQSAPRRPSFSLQTVALKNSLKKSELDAIVLKALSMKPERRYESAGAFMKDIQRFLQGRPVEARLDTNMYRLRKWIGRNKAAALASVIAMVALIGGLTVSLMQTQKAQRELARAEAVGNYLRDILLSPQPDASSPMQLGSNASIGDLLDAAERALEEDLEDQPSVKIELYNTIATAQMWMSNMDAALRSTRKAVELASDDGIASEEELIEAIHVMATVLEDDYQVQAAIKAYKEAIELANKVGLSVRDLHVLVRNDLAVAYANINDWENAMAYQKEALSFLNDEINGEDTLRVALLANLGSFHFELGEVAQAEKSLRQAIKLEESLDGADYYSLRARRRLARLLHFTGRNEEALIEYRAFIDLSDLEHIEAEYEIASAHLRIALIQIEQGTLQPARELVERYRIEFAEYLEDEEAWIFHYVDGHLLLADKKYAEALKASLKAHDLSIEMRLPRSEQIRIDWLVAKALHGLGQYDEASERFRAAQERAADWYGPSSYLIRDSAGFFTSRP